MKKINSHIELIFVIIISLIVFITTFYFKENLVIIFLDEKFSINEQLTNLFGTVFGLILTAYAIFFGLIPLLNKDFKNTEAYKKMNFRFFFATIMSLILLVISLVSNFLKQEILVYVIPILISLSTLVILLFFLLSTYLYLIFKSDMLLK